MHKQSTTYLHDNLWCLTGYFEAAYKWRSRKAFRLQWEADKIIINLVYHEAALTLPRPMP